MRLVAVTVLVMSAGCGGGQEGFTASYAPNTEAVFAQTPATAPNKSSIPANLPTVRAELSKPAVLKPATTEDPVFTVEDEQGNKRSSFALFAERGKGFSELKLMLTARTIGESSPPSPIRPSCRETNKCEYRLTKTYTVTLSDESTLQMIPRGDGVAIVARVIDVDAPKAVDVLFSVDSKVFSKRQIVLLAE